MSCWPAQCKIPIVVISTTKHVGLLTFVLQLLGVTARIPETVPSVLIGSKSGPQDWIYDGEYVWNNGDNVSHPFCPPPSNLYVKEKVGIMLSEEGNLHVCRDGKLYKNVVSALPVKTPLWGMVDVCGRCTNIKSELLNGKWDVYVLPP